MSVWIIIVAIGVLTFATRLSFIAILDRYPVPARVQRALRFVPLAVLSAIILPELALHGGALDLSLTNARLLAGTLAVLVAFFTRNALLTIVVGMGSLWLLLNLQQLLGALHP